MAKFATAADALTAQIAVIDARLRNIEIGSDPELYLELSNKRAIIQQAIGVTLSGDITIDDVTVTASALPTGASTSALQSASLADAGDDASQAIAVQGLTGGKAIPVTQSGTWDVGINGSVSLSSLPDFANTPTVNIGTAPSLTITNTAFTANAGTNLNTSALALESGGNLANLAAATAAPNAPLPARVVLMGGNFDDDYVIRPIRVDEAGYLILSAESSIVITTLQTTYTHNFTEPGTSPTFNMAGYTKAFIVAIVANINTNVVVRIEISNDGASWVNASATDTDTTITTNGATGFHFQGCPAQIRFNFVSESGGTSATIATSIRVSQ